MSVVNSNTFSKTFSIDNNVSIVVLIMLSTQPIECIVCSHSLNKP